MTFAIKLRRKSAHRIDFAAGYAKPERRIRPVFEAQIVKMGGRRHSDLSKTVGKLEYRAVLNNGEGSTRELSRVQRRPAAAEDRVAGIAVDLE